MKYLKKILFPLFSIFLGYRLVVLVEYLVSSDPINFNSLNFFFFSVLLTLYCTGIFAFIGFVYATNNVLPDKYYIIKNPKSLALIYDKLGVNYFKLLILFAFWGKKSNRKKYFNGTKKGLENFIFQTKQSEFGHLAALILIIILSIFLLFYGYFVLVVMMTIINIIGNLYPIILQRFHRIRIEELTTSFKKKDI